MSFVTPSRVAAALWLGGVVLLGLMTDGVLPWWLFSDRDSVPQLTLERACALAQDALNDPRLTCRVQQQGEAALTLEVTSPRRSEEGAQRVCFLKARRWFVVDRGPDIDCPERPPASVPRITSELREQLEEGRWRELVRASRESAQRRAFVKGLLGVTDQLSEPAPERCEVAFGAQRTLAVLDTDVLFQNGKSWPFLSTAAVAALAAGESQQYSSAGLRRSARVLALVELKTRVEPVEQNPGAAHGVIALVDWVEGKVLCKAPFDVVQPENAPRDLNSLAPLRADFRARVTEALRRQLLAMSNGQVEVLELQ